MSLFAAALRLTGLSTREAGDYLTAKLGRPVSHQTVMDLSSGRSRVHPDVWAALRDLWRRQSEAADQALDLIEELAAEHGPPEALDVSAFGRAGEWPSLRAAENVAALVALESGLPVADD